MSADATLAYHREGTGAPLLLVHGIGHRRQMWRPIIDRLRDRFDAVAVDLPGFGDSPRLPPGQRPTPGRLADELAALMTALGWGRAHLVGNSLGGWLALELARRGRAYSVTALMPAGLWRRGHGSDSFRHRTLFALWRGLARTPGATTLIRSRAVRTMTLFGLFGRPWRIPPDIAAGDAANLRSCDIRRTMHEASGHALSGGRSIAVPITVTLGTRDPLIRRRDLDLTELPAHARVLTLAGAGHVPTWDDPVAVTGVIVATTYGSRDGNTVPLPSGG